MDVTRVLMSVRIQSEEEVARAAEAIEQRAENISNVTYTHPNDDGSVSEDTTPRWRPRRRSAPWRRRWRRRVRRLPKVGRNDPCPCGSGKKYKQCHGKLA